MLSKQEKRLLTLWILLLSFASGYANVVAILGHLWPVSHMTGLTSQLALALAQGESEVMILLIRGFLLFFLGGVLSGILFHEKSFKLEGRYGGILFLGGMVIFLLRDSSFLYLFLFFYMGLVNGMFIHYRGILVRTTHVTGYLTDASFELGLAFRGKKIQFWKIGFYLGSIFLFFLGGYAATLSGVKTTRLLSYLYLLLGAYYFAIRRRHHWE